MSKEITPQTNYSYEDDRVSAFFGLLLFIVSAFALYLVCANFANQPTTRTTEFQHKTETNGGFTLSNAKDDETYPQVAERVVVNTAQQALYVDGIQEVGEPIKFTIKHFSPEAQYRIDFGNGQFHEVTQQNIVYTYDRSATYQVQVQIEYNGKVKTISTKTLDIFDAIEMRASIAEVEF